MALKDTWVDLEDEIDGVANSGDDISVKPINDIAHAVIENEDDIKKIKENGGSGSIIVDDEMSSTSTNPVQNKVVKAYVDILDDRVDSALAGANGAFIIANEAKTIAMGSSIGFDDDSTILLEDNTNYKANGDISTLTIQYPNVDFMCSIEFTTSELGDINISLPNSSYIGAIPEFANGETWELNIKNGVVVGGKVE